MSLGLHYWMRGAHHCSGPPSPKWPILCRVGRKTVLYHTIVDPYIKFPELSRTHTDFQALEKGEKFQKFQELSSRRGNHVFYSLDTLTVTRPTVSKRWMDGGCVQQETALQCSRWTNKWLANNNSPHTTEKQTCICLKVNHRVQLDLTRFSECIRNGLQ